ncbi:MAG: endonuclease MutS2 [Acidobacteria bacterium]|nr:endonuclease MutS2 [Acidobacteriota bacterium]
MNPQSFEILEYPALRELLAGRTQTPLGKSRALQLEPSINREEILENLKRTSECVRLFHEHAGFSLGGLPDPHDILRLLRIEEVRLEPKQILDLIRLIEAGPSLRLTFAGIEPGYPHLMKLIRALPDLQALLKKLRGKILPDGDIDDNASPELRFIRQEIQHVRARLQKRLQAILRQSPDAFIQEDIITIRNERFVIPIRVEHKGQIPGVIHAASSSGATVFIEPLDTIELNNELVELHDREQAEIGSILLEMSNNLRAELEALERLAALITEIDLIGARARLAIDFNCCEPTLTEGYKLTLIEARHILLEHTLRQQGQPIVPISIQLDDDHPVMIISGPNAGGKTVALKTVGLCALMAQSGLHVPAQDAALPVFHQILPDIGDQQSIVANLSTFTAHIQNVRQMAETLSPPGLVLLDEVGTGTDPEEGAALAVAIVDFFKRHGAMVIATTHYQNLKMYAQLTSGVVSASVEFDEEKLQPTYRLLQGLAGSSSGIEIARRMGLSDEMIERARQRLKVHDQDAAHYLRQLKSELERQHSIRAALEEERKAVTEKLNSLEREFARREENRRKVFEARLKEVVDEYSRQARELLSQVRDRKAQLTLQRTIDRQTTRLKTELRKQMREEEARLPDAEPRRVAKDIELKVGDAVRLLDINKTGTIASIDKDEVIVEAGPLRFKTRQSNLEPISEEAAKPADGESHAGGITVELKSRPELSLELNLIGCTVEQALERADKFLDEAYLASLRTVRIIHGVGTGALRRAIRAMLASHPHVASFQPGDERTPDAGAVTIVELRQD